MTDAIAIREELDIQLPRKVHPFFAGSSEESGQVGSCVLERTRRDDKANWKFFPDGDEVRGRLMPWSRRQDGKRAHAIAFLSLVLDNRRIALL
jgi:hypothetical protein